MVSRIFFLAILATTFYWHENYWRSVWWDKWFLLMISCVGFLSYQFGKRFHWSVGLFFFIAASSAAWVFGWRNSYQLDLLTIVAMGKITTYSFAAFLTLLATVSFFKKEDFKTADIFFAIVCFLNSIYIIYEWLDGRRYELRGGFFGNPSMSGCLIAFTYPFLCLQKRERIPVRSYIASAKRLLYVFVPITAIILTNQSQPMGVLVVVLCAWYFAKRRSYKDFAAAISIFIGIGFFALWVVSDRNNNIFSSCGRTVTWMMTFTWWRDHGHWLLGQGTGISQVLVPLLQKAALLGQPEPSTMNWWLWLHSDWLQLLFENGIVGFFAGLTMYVFALYKSYQKEAWLFSAVAGIGATAFFNFPAHFPLHAFIGIVILAMAFDRNYLENKSIYVETPSM